MKYETGKDMTDEEVENLEKLTTLIYFNKYKEGEFYIKPAFTTDVKLIGIGAPTKIFLEDVATLLGTEADFPKDGKIANAIGAAMGNISTECVVTVEPYRGIKSSYLTYVITGGPKTFSLPEYDEAIAEAKKIARAGAIQRAYQQGAAGQIDVEIQVFENTYQRNKYRHVEILNTVITARAILERE